MNVRMPPCFGIWAVAGAAMVAIQRTAPRPAAATPDLLIMTSLLLLSRIDRCTNPEIICGEASVGGELVALDESNTPRCRPPSGWCAPPGDPDGFGGSWRPRSGNGDETRSRRRIDRARHLAFHRSESAAGLDARIRHRYGVEKGPGIGIHRVVEQLVGI